MKRSAKIFEFKNKKLETVEDVRDALIAIIEDIQAGNVTVTEAKPIRDESNMIMRKLCAQMNSAKLKDKAELKTFFGK
jgi:hypothetical protein